MLGEVIDGGARSTEVVARCLQDWNVDAREILLVWNHPLPVRVVGRMVDPSIEDRVWLAVDLVQVTIRAAARIPGVIQFAPAIEVEVGGVVQLLVVESIERPRIDETQKKIAVHRHIDSRSDRDGGNDRLQRLRQLLRRRPLRESLVASTKHPHLTVAPRLLGDPVDEGSRIDAIVLVRDRSVRAAAFASGKTDHSDVPVRSGATGVADVAL